MKISVFLSRFPYPLTKGDKLRAYHQIVELSKHHDIYLFCLNHEKISEDDVSRMRPYCKDIEIFDLKKPLQIFRILFSFFSPLPLQVVYYRSHKAKQAYNAFLSEHNPDICYYQFVRTAPYAENQDRYQVLDFQDTLSANMYRRAKKSNILSKFFFLYEARKLRRYESKMFDIFDMQTIITASDRDLLADKRRNTVRIVANGLGEKYLAEPQATGKKYDILFCGNMGYKPNIVAALFLLKEIMPLVWTKSPEATVCIAGINPPESVRRLAGKHVTIAENVPDMRQMYLQSRFFIAPMQIGTGLQNKLLEAMSCSVCCISSSLANKALGAKDEKQILIADTAEENAEALLRCLHSEDEMSKIGKAARKYVLSHFSWEEINRIFDALPKKQ